MSFCDSTFQPLIPQTVHTPRVTLSQVRNPAFSLLQFHTVEASDCPVLWFIKISLQGPQGSQQLFPISYHLWTCLVSLRVLHPNCLLRCWRALTLRYNPVESKSWPVASWYSEGSAQIRTKLWVPCRVSVFFFGHCYWMITKQRKFQGLPIRKN